jgi:hypothetical protein
MAVQWHTMMKYDVEILTVRDLDADVRVTCENGDVHLETVSTEVFGDESVETAVENHAVWLVDGYYRNN